MTRAQSHVVGVALMLGIGLLALGTLTVSVGQFVDAQTASADATRIADRMDSALEAAEATGPRTSPLRFSGGRLVTQERDLRVLRNGSVVAVRSVDALVFEAEDRRVAYSSGAIVRGPESGAWLVRDPPVTASARTAVVVVGAPRLGAGHLSISGRGSVRLRLRTNVTHSRRALGVGRYAVALETATPAPFERYFEQHNATVRHRDIDGDGVESVLARYSGLRRGYLITHNLSLEVEHG